MCGVDRIDSSTDPLPCRLGAQNCTHIPKLWTTGDKSGATNRVTPKLWMKPRLWISQRSPRLDADLAFCGRQPYIAAKVTAGQSDCPDDGIGGSAGLR